ESHMKMIGMIKEEGLDEHQQKLVDAKRAEYDAQQNKASGNEQASEFPAGAQLCAKCSTQAVVMMDGCMTCLSCGDSKCG
ncbi:MAG: NrdJb, partial [Gammaproteobacteria bacterium]|nr:NrdJb [Gammaproteobacteria bacterium]